MNNSHIIINGNYSAVIDGCRQISECTEIMVRLVTSAQEIEIWGSNLMLSFFNEGSVEVSGKLEEIKLIEKEKNKCF